MNLRQDSIVPLGNSIFLEKITTFLDENDKKVLKKVVDSYRPFLQDIRKINNNNIDILVGHFFKINDPKVQRELFKNSVKRIILETSSFCNRTCSFCPNKSGIRLEKDPNYLFDPNLYSAILQDLKEIDYNGTVLLHLYNEPLANPNICEQISEVKSHLPNAFLSFNSNGDFINSQIMDDLAEAGLNEINISLYGPRNGEFVEEYLWKRIYRIGRILNILDDIKILKLKLNNILRKTGAFMGKQRDSFMVVGDYKDIRVKIFAKNFNIKGYDRGQIIESNITSQRISPCFSPFFEFLVGYNGFAVPCCNIHPSHPSHSQYLIKDLIDGKSIFDTYCNSQLLSWRKSLFSFYPSDTPCNTCDRSDQCKSTSENDIALFNNLHDHIFKKVASETDMGGISPL